MVSVRTVFAHPDAEHVHFQLDVIAACSVASFARPKPCSAMPPRIC
jgi:hypothetical protein